MVETSSASIEIAPEVKEMMIKSLGKDKWAPLELGVPTNFTSEAVQARWEK